METIHRRIQVRWIGLALVGVAVLAAIAVGVDRFAYALPWLPVVGGLALLAVLVVVHALLRYRRWRFAVEDDALFLVRGVLTRVDTSVPFVRVQHVDTKRDPVDRALGLSRVVVYTAGTRGADIEIPGLRPARATELRERLRDLAIESEAADAV